MSRPVQLVSYADPFAILNSDGTHTSVSCEKAAFQCNEQLHDRGRPGGAVYLSGAGLHIWRRLPNGS